MTDTLAPMSTPSCPDENALARFARGHGRDLELPAIEAHLDACESCRRAVAAAASTVTLPTLPPSQDLTPGVRVGRYEVERELGRGGMGVVYMARDVTLDRRVALKLLHARRDEAAQARLLREAQVMARLAHPNVVPVFELGDWRGDLYLVMELVNGLTLDAWLKGAKHSPAEILARFVEAGRGLAAAHAAGVVHRDFKPANVLVGVDGRVRVTDFGLSRPGPAVELPPMASPLITREGAIVGTVAYMAPEQLDGRPADERSDQFAFCVSLAEALTGQRPFQGDNWAALAVSLARPPRLDGVPARLRGVLRRGLSSDPSRRYTSMSALLNAVEAGARPSRTLAVAVLGAAISLGCAAGAWVLVARPGAAPAAAVAEGENLVPIAAASQDIPEGTVLTMDMVVQRVMPEMYVTSSIVRPDAVSRVVNQRVTVPIQKNDPLLWTQFETSTAEQQVAVEVAAAQLAEGTVVTAAMLEERSVPANLATSSVVKPGTASSAVGHRLMVPVQKGDLLLWSQLSAATEMTRGAAPLTLGPIAVGASLELHWKDLTRFELTAVQSLPGADPKVLEVTRSGERLTLKGLGPGEATLTVWAGQKASRFFVTVESPRELAAAPRQQRTLSLEVGGRQVLTLPGVRRVAIGDASVADVTTLGDGRLAITGGSEGKTTLLVWTRDDQPLSYLVSVREPESADAAAPSIAGTRWQFPAKPAAAGAPTPAAIEVSFLDDGTVRFSNSAAGGRWTQHGAQVVFDSNGFTEFRVTLKGDAMTGTWTRLKGPQVGLTSPAALARADAVSVELTLKDAPNGGQSLEAADIMEVVMAHRPELARCIQAQRQQDPAVSGKLVLGWSIEPSGAVKGLHVETPELARTSAATCISAAVAGWTFPKSPKGQQVVTFPFKF